MRQIALILSLTFGLACTGGAFAQSQDETLADIRQELTVLYVEIQKLKRELSTTGGAGPLEAGGSALQRLDAIEAEVQRLTSKTEQMEHRIDQVVRDGTNRIGDLEFRLVELEGGDLSKLGDTPTLGGGAMPETPAIAPPPHRTQPSRKPNSRSAKRTISAAPKRRWRRAIIRRRRTFTPSSCRPTPALRSRSGPRSDAARRWRPPVTPARPPAPSSTRSPARRTGRTRPRRSTTSAGCWAR
jgi:hypothetical protein